MSVRSSVKANWISRQYDSSAATSSGVRSATAAVAAITSGIPTGRSANAKPGAPPASRRNERRLDMRSSFGDERLKTVYSRLGTCMWSRSMSVAGELTAEGETLLFDCPNLGVAGQDLRVCSEQGDPKRTGNARKR